MTDKTCSTCVNWQPKSSGDLARFRLAVCARGPRWKFYPPQATCPKHEAAAPEVVQGRALWLEAGK